MLIDGGLVLLDVSLVQQADLSEEVVHTALDLVLSDHLTLGLGDLGVGSALFQRLGQLDGLLLLHFLRGNLSGGDIGRAHSGDLHGQVLAQLHNSGLVLNALSLQVDQNADLAVHVDIGNIDAIGIADEAADLDVLADGQNLVGGDSVHGTVGAGIGGGLQGLHIGRILLGDDGSYVTDELLEGGVLGDEVGLGVDLDDSAHAAVNDSSIAHALSGDLAGLLGLGSQALLTQPVDCLVLIAVSGNQCLLAVHHTNAGQLTELLDQLCSNCSHGKYLL